MTLFFPSSEVAALSPLDRLLAPQIAEHPGKSGARLLSQGAEALAIRAASARAAVRSIDLQYYIWRNDSSGRLLVQELLHAADRGVHVRLLLDDMDARSRDQLLVAFDRHKEIEVRVFNPFRTRHGVLRTARELLVRASRLNHRMHNKSWIVDGRLAIVGGRNIGDEYFAASDDMNFIDMDVAVVGRAVEDAIDVFEEYWNSKTVRPIRRFRRLRRTQLTLDALRARVAAANAAQPSASATPAPADIPPDGLDGLRRLEWSGVRIVADDPRKAQRGRSRRPGVLEEVVAAFESARRELLIISPYLVPGPGGTATLRQIARRGVRVVILTNSLAATDVAAVHSGYSRYRNALIDGGIELYELKASAAGLDERRIGVGASRASLHTKAIVVDDARILVGSFNLDPRSAQLNCEMGVWLDAAPLVRELRDAFASAISPRRSYRLSLDASGGTRWSEECDGRTVEHTRDPHASLGRRLLTCVLSGLPIESHL
ncbi:MAG TPA: phospholipase D family protein [Steroidobacter sp.]|nr:phospholipase D family protein [Steroidobacteraceae bacterium]HLS80937.1 phospholipase D family protein [Steroidobacter sp.]